MGAELCLAHDMGGGGIGGPLLVDMWPYSCFIFGVSVVRNSGFLFAYPMFYILSKSIYLNTQCFCFHLTAPLTILQ